MKELCEKIRKTLLSVEWTLAGAFLALTTFSVFFQVVSRYFLHLSLSWPEELARFSFIWTSLLGACIAWERGKLHDIDIIFNLFPAGWKPYINLCSSLFVCGMLGVLVIYGTQLLALVHRQVSPALEIRMSYVYSAVPFASLLILISYVLDTIEKISDIPLFGGMRRTI